MEVMVELPLRPGSGCNVKGFNCRVASDGSTALYILVSEINKFFGGLCEPRTRRVDILSKVLILRSVL